MKLIFLAAFAAVTLLAQKGVPRYGVFDVEFKASGKYGNPYVDASADAVFSRPDGGTLRVPLFWDGESTWRARISPNALGKWSYRVASSDAGLDGKSGEFECVASNLTGGIRASPHWPNHFVRENGAPFWFMGDTAWAYFTDIAEEKHDRAKAEEYVKARAAQGFNVIHSMLLSEGGDGNRNGPPWIDIAQERINPAYFREAEERVAFANRNGVTVGIAAAWGNKKKTEAYSWGRIPSPEARKRYARYVAARFGAYDTYFLVSGEWHAEVRSRGDQSEEQVFRELVEIGDAMNSANPQHRMIGIHPMTGHGSVREFASAPWMSFGDYQQNYHHLHQRIVLSRSLPGPVVNSEYGYFLRDQDGDGKPDKSNSHSADDMRFASWDIVMGGGYLVTGFGTTYFGGHRDPSPFDLRAEKNRVWEQQMGFIKKLFTATDWWKLIPADELISSTAAREEDRGAGADLHPPKATYWALANPGQTYLAYVRGLTEAVNIELGARARKFRVRTYNPRSGEFSAPIESTIKDRYTFRPADAGDWVVLLEAIL